MGEEGTQTTTPAADGATTQTTTPAQGQPDSLTAFSAITGQGAANAAGGQEPIDTAQVIGDDYQFKLPDGLEVSKEVSAAFLSIAKEAGLTAAQADKLIDMHANLMLAPYTAQQERNRAWADEASKLGLSSNEGIAAAKLAIDTFGGGEVAKLLVDTGVIYNPGVLSMLKNIGELLTEDHAPEGKEITGTKNLGDVFFPNSK